MHSSQCIESLQEMFVKWLSSWHQAHLLPRLLHLSFSGLFANLIHVLGTIHSHSLSSVSSGSFGSAYSPIEIISIPSFLSSWKTSCHPTSFLKIYSIFFRTQITMTCHCQWLAQYLCPEASHQWLAPFVTHPIIFQNCQLQQASPLLTVPSVAIVSFILLCN